MLTRILYSKLWPNNHFWFIFCNCVLSKKRLRDGFNLLLQILDLHDIGLILCQYLVDYIWALFGTHHYYLIRFYATHSIFSINTVSFYLGIFYVYIAAMEKMVLCYRHKKFFIDLLKMIFLYNSCCSYTIDFSRRCDLWSITCIHLKIEYLL